MGQIYWDQLSWEAFATMAVGAVTVVAAYLVGRRQVEISKRQTNIAAQQSEILAHQARIDEFSLRAEVFDRRFEVYEASHELLAFIVRSAAPVPSDIQNKFLVQKMRARFLFSPALNAELQLIWEAVCSFDQTHSTTRHAYQTTGSYGADLSQHHQNQARINERFSALAETFSTEMSLAMLDANSNANAR